MSDHHHQSFDRIPFPIEKIVSNPLGAIHINLVANGIDTVVVMVVAAVRSSHPRGVVVWWFGNPVVFVGSIFDKYHRSGTTVPCDNTNDCTNNISDPSTGG